MSRLISILGTMTDKKISKYLNGATTSAEEKEVEVWITSSDQNAKKFYSIKAKYVASSFDESVSDIDQVYNSIIDDKQATKKNKSRFLLTTLKYAAVLVLLIGGTYLFKDYFIVPSQVPMTSEDAITLQLNDGTLEIISENGTARVVDSEGNVLGAQKGRQLVYKNTGSVKEELIYNTLTVPYGKRFDIVLSDGTQVILNSGTSLKYPVQFIKGDNRRVFLNGEAFFTVAKDKLHPFIVNADELNVRVLGTKFNLSSYPEDQFVNTTLVEGSVSVYESNANYDSSNSSLLKPGYKSEWNKHNKQISIAEADIAMHTDWLNGKIILRHVPFKNIVKKLERHYNVDITNNNKGLDNEMFSASFDIETIDQVFRTFNESYEIDYKINNRQIIIN